jgi:hypothetical protein
MNEAIDVVTAAIPTNAWNAATVYGSSVTAILYPTDVPITADVPSNAIA